MGKRKESIIKKSKSCFFCGSEYQLECHHCIHGTANRRLADVDGLWVWLCAPCHREIHGKHGHNSDELLKATAEYAWMEENGYIDRERHLPTEEGIRKWIERYGKNWL